MELESLDLNSDSAAYPLWNVGRNGTSGSQSGNRE